MKVKKLILPIVLPLLAGVFIYIFFGEPVTFRHKIPAIHESWWTLPAINFLFHFSNMWRDYTSTASISLIAAISKYACAAHSLLFLSMDEFNQANWNTPYGKQIYFRQCP